MESKINYTLVGLFVVVLSISIIIFAFWLGKSLGKQEYDYYHVYMSESVAGLSPDASVKYQGVGVGTVQQIVLNPKNPEQVKLLLKIEHLTPINVHTTATLKSFGLTGLTYIELTGGGKDSPLLDVIEGSIPTIPSRPSTFARIDESLSHLSSKIALALDTFNRLLSDKNLKNVTDILSEINLLTKESRGQLQGLEQLIDHGVVAEKNMSTAFSKLATASDSVKKMADSLERNSSDVGQIMSQEIQQSLDLFNHLLFELDILTGILQRTTQSIEASPSDLFFKQTLPKPGPGEEGYNEK